MNRGPTRTSAGSVTSSGGARQRLLDAAYELFSSHGIQAVGVDAVVARAGVARQTMYRHFDSKDSLVLAFLALREERWLRQWLQVEVERRASQPRDRLLAMFDAFDEWFQEPTFEGCSFTQVMLEHPDVTHPLNRAAVRCLERLREFIANVAEQAKIRDPEGFAREWHLLLLGSIVAAQAGDRAAAVRARRIGDQLLSGRSPHRRANDAPAAASGPGSR